MVALPSLTPIVFIIFLLPSLKAITCDFDSYLIKFGKAYVNGSAEYLYHSLIYSTNCNLINSHNSDPASTYTLQETKCTDLLENDCIAAFNLNPLDLSSIAEHSETPSLLVSTVSASPPASLDYRTLGYVTSVKNQLSCGCCWAFASIATYQSWLLMKGYNYGLSQEASLECTYLYAPNQRKSNCTGGYLVDAMNYLAKVGGVLRSNYPYISGSISSGSPATTPGICTETNRIYLGNGSYTFYSNLSTSQIKQLLTDKGPVMVGIYANTPFMAYASGIFSGCPANASSYINHAVELIGYDSSGNWIVKNQWGVSWGDSGYMTVSQTLDCGLSKAVVGIDFTSYSTSVSMTLDPTVYQTNGTDTKNGESYIILGCLMLGVMLML